MADYFKYNGPGGDQREEDKIGTLNEAGDLDFALRHARANKIGFDDPDPEKKRFICRCCFQNVNKKDFEYCCSVEDLSVVGVGYTLYFKLIQNLKYLMYLMTIFHSSITFYLNVRGTSCQVYDPIEANQKNLCEANIYNSTSIANRVDEEKKTGLQVAIDTAFFYVLLVSLFVIRLNLFYETIKTKGNRGQDISDFSLFAMNLPKMGILRLRVLIERYFEALNLSNGISYEVESISFIFDNREYNALHERKERLQADIKGLTEYSFFPALQNEADQLPRLEQEHEEVLQQIQAIEVEYAESDYRESSLFSGKAFITFKSYGAAYDLLQRYSEEFYTTKLWRKSWNWIRGNNGTGKTNIRFEDRDLRIFPAVHPKNFIWENACVSNFEKYSRRGIILLIEVVLFVGCFLIVSTIIEYQIGLRTRMLLQSVEDSVRSREFIIMQLIGLFTTLVFVVVNKVTTVALRQLAFFEKHEKKTSMDTSIAEKLSFQYFINSSLIIFVINSQYDSLWSYGGLVYLAAFFMVTNCLAKIFTCYVDVFYIWKIITQWLYLKNRPKMSQKTLNETFEYNEFDFASYTASILSAVYHCFFFASMVPIVGVANILTQIMEYYLHKYVIIVRCSSKKKFGDTLLLQVLNYVDMSLIFYSLGTMMTYYTFVKRLPTVYLWNLAISVLYCLLPLNHITRKLVRVPKEHLGRRYKDYKSRFDSENYSIYNPINYSKYVEMSEIST
jgi:hypothetical protein